jgi:HK97 family phage major capsid protein
MSALLEAKNGMRTLAAKASQTVSDNSLTMAEKKNVLDNIDVDMKAYAETIAVHEQASRLMAGGEAAVDAKSSDEQEIRAKSLGEQITDSEAYRQAVLAKAAGSRFSHTTEIKAPGLMTEGTGFAGGFPNGTAGPAIMPDYLPGIVDLRFRKLVIADLFAQGSTTSNQISYVKETAFNNGAAPVAEGTKKPLSDGSIARVNEQVGKIAHLMKMTDEMVADAPQFRTFMENRLVFGVKLREDSELLTGTGYPSVPGLLGRSGMQSEIDLAGATSLAGIEGVFSQITAIRTNAFVEPDAVVINPLDWEKIRLGKDANGQYYAGGPFVGSYGQGGYSNVSELWGLRAVITPAIAEGTILVGGFQECGQVFRRQGITVELTNSNQDDFENNLITARAEERLALAVYRPGGFGVVKPTWA